MRLNRRLENLFKHFHLSDMGCFHYADLFILFFVILVFMYELWSCRYYNECYLTDYIFPPDELVGARIILKKREVVYNVSIKVFN